MIPTRRFGRTEMAMPVLTCGGMRYQHSWKDEDAGAIPDHNQANLEATIERALALGINHIETARGYGTSEVQLGRILPRLPRDQMIVQTKILPKGDGRTFRETFEKSLSNLQLDAVDLLSIHGINNAALLEHTLSKDGPLAEARKIQREGRTRFIGFSTHGDCESISAAIHTGEFDYVNLHWYWVNRSNTAAILDAHRHDMGVFIISPNDKGGKLYAPSEKFRQACDPISPMAFNNLFCLSNPLVHTLSVGAARPSDFDEHVASLALLDRGPDLVESISLRLHQLIADVTGADWLAHWGEGIPRWEDCPHNINILEILRLWMFAKALDMTSFAKMRYNLLGQAEHWFPGNPAASFTESEILAAVANSPFRHKIPDILREAHAMLFDKPAERLSKS